MLVNTVQMLVNNAFDLIIIYELIVKLRKLMCLLM